MPFDKAGLKTEIESILTDMRTRSTNSDAEFATRLSEAIDKFVKTGKAQKGQTVAVTGSSGTTTTDGNLY